ncbi:hypothetical protein LP316_03285 [Thalassotalea sp. LPB0316]|uniref:hypothetical protein n=1 Tax=Thalassotalea sp. LPB0316 TaxID=2769490 RepID=UPI001868D20D|nr:hypothetical protein [Thalassotalea sp. LPB0316]QOL26343.1 hypothetical protein LP316_03285 [Thalassotalea sp. LPB0316]
MKYWIILLTFFSSYSLASTTKFECKYHDYNLVLKAGGNDHIVHELSINGKFVIDELIEGIWFIEEINCRKEGYEIIASHIQFNDPTQKSFMLTYHPDKGYKIEAGI